MGAFLKGTLTGGIVIYMWGFISWVVLGLHYPSLNPIGADDQVFAAIASSGEGGSVESGIYVAPYADPEIELSEEEEKAAMDRWQAGPVAFIAYRAGEGMSMGAMYGVGGLMCLLAAAFATLIVLQAGDVSFGKRFLMCFFAFALAGALGTGQNWVYWSFPADYSIAQLIDLGAQGVLGGLVIAAFAK